MVAPFIDGQPGLAVAQLLKFGWGRGQIFVGQVNAVCKAGMCILGYRTRGANMIDLGDFLFGFG